ncbi:MAG: hypothetical protein IJ365_08820, partial [Clostridia bacterium]|nr:hypothetical protein [Clostridia bacterium]
VVGEETFSEPISYVYYDTQIPTAQIDSIKLTNGAFVMKYTYVSPDYLPEGATAIQWYMSDSLFGDYQIIDGAGSDTYTPADKTAYYKVAVNPVDKEGNAGEEIMSDAFMYTDVADSSTAVSSAIAAITLPENTNVNLEFLTEDENGVYYTWVSSDESIIAADGTIYRPAKDAEDVSVNITVYAVCGFDIKSAEYTVVVNKYSTAPVITAAALGQTARPIVVDYTFEDADGDAEGETVYEWYYKADADSEFTLIEGASSSMYAPSSNMDGYIFIAKITPADATYTYGEQYTTAEYTYTYQSPAIPSAQVGTVDYGIGALTGVYTYTNIDGIAEGDSDYQWYVSKTLLGEYSAIEGETGISLRRSSDYDGKFIKFSVTPKDAEGVTGETVYSNPVHMESYEPETFDDESVIASSVDASALKGGTVEIVEDPADSSNNVLALTRTLQTNGEMSMISVLAPSYSGMKGMVMDIDVYPSSSLSGTWEMLYIGGTGHGYKLWHSGRSSLLSRGGATYINGVWKEDSTYTVSTAFTKDNWHHIRVVQDFNNQMTLETSLDGEVVQTDIPFRCAINTVEKITSFIQNSFVGTGYMDNFVITPIYDATNMAVVDANAINLGSDLTSVISNLKLPTIGETNDSIIVWTSSDDSVITSKGKVIRPESAEGDKTV